MEIDVLGEKRAVAWAAVFKTDVQYTEQLIGTLYDFANRAFGPYCKKDDELIRLIWMYLVLFYLYDETAEKAGRSLNGSYQWWADDKADWNLPGRSIWRYLLESLRKRTSEYHVETNLRWMAESMGEYSRQCEIEHEFHENGHLWKEEDYFHMRSYTAGLAPCLNLVSCLADEKIDVQTYEKTIKPLYLKASLVCGLFNDLLSTRDLYEKNIKRLATVERHNAIALELNSELLDFENCGGIERSQARIIHDVLYRIHGWQATSIRYRERANQCVIVNRYDASSLHETERLLVLLPEGDSVEISKKAPWSDADSSVSTT